MKKAILCFVVLIWMTSGFSQSTSVNYADKCNKQRKTGWILFGTGASLATTGFLITEIDGKGDNSMLSENFDVGGWTFFTGLAGCIGSIPFFLSANQSCKKSKRVSFNIKNIKGQSILTNIPKRIPSLSISFDLNDGKK